MSKIEHSPLPWHMENYEEWYDVLTEKGGSIAESTNFHNAQFIVTACNSYYDNQQAIAELERENKSLFEALKYLLAIYDGVPMNAIVAAGFADEARALIAKHKAKP